MIDFEKFVSDKHPKLIQKEFYKKAIDEAFIMSHMPGWQELFVNFLKEVEARLKREGINRTNFNITELKEKYGALRIYVEVDIDLSELCSKYEDLSSETCMYCGSVGTIREINGWYEAICDECLANERR